MIPDDVYANCSKDATVKMKFAQQARDDWLTFLRHREAELVPGA